MEQLGYFGEWLRQRREALDLTRPELARSAGCSVSALRKIETGERRPSKQLAGLLAQGLRIPPGERATFVRAARGELRPGRLGAPSPALSDERPALTPLSNLPVPPTPLIGRESELVTLSGLLRDPQCRLLTVVGLGGIGKTRLAIEVASRCGDLFPDGVYMAELASLDLSAHLVPAIADALGLTFQGQNEPRAQLVNHLRTRQALLVLDNVEHLLDGVELFSELLARAPGVKLLFTSRERLQLRGEWVFEIQGLPVPTYEEVARAEEYSSVALFIQSARRIQVGFELQAEDRPSVVRICQVVEGLPLGIELAAAWIPVLSCDEIAQEIERGLDFAATSLRGLPERQRSLEAVFDHSWNLLSTEERQVLSRLAIFHGDFGRDAAEWVAGATLPALLALASKSLVRRTERGRYDLHQVVRQYALARLAEDPQSKAARDRHCEYYLALLRDREAALKSAAQRETSRELIAEMDNLRAAWAWAVNRGKFAAIGPALRCFGYLFDLSGRFREGVGQMEMVVRALQRAPEDEGQQRVLGQALAQQGMLYFRWGRYERAVSLFERSLAILRPFGDPALLLDLLLFKGIIMFLWGETDRALSLLEECLACARTADARWFEAYALYNVGYIASLLGRYREAYGQMLAGLALWRKLGDPRHTALGLNWISPTAIYLGRYDEAEARLQESLMLCTEVGDRWGMGTAYRHLGLLALARGDPIKACSLLRKSLDLFVGFVTGWDVVQSLVYLGEATIAAGNGSEGRQIYLDALQRTTEARSPSLALDILVRLADLQVQAGQAEVALALAICVLGHPASTYEARDRAGHVCAQLEAMLGPQQVQAIQVRVQAGSLDALVTELLDASPMASV